MINRPFKLLLALLAPLMMTASGDGWAVEQASPPVSALTVKAEVQTLSISRGWDYWEHSTRDAQRAVSQDQWQRIDLPHTWNAFDATDEYPGYRRAGGWYRKALEISEDSEGLRHILHFEGANMTSDVYVNGVRAGGHVGGYLGFDVDITDYLAKGGLNTVLVRVDNSVNLDLIPSQKADFVIFGGLSRDVFLKVRRPVFVDRVFIDTPAVSAGQAATNVGVSVKNYREAGPLTLDVAIRDAGGKTVLTARRNIQSAIGESGITIEMPVLETPALWHVDEPVLYTAEAKLIDAAGTVLDTHTERFGYRWFEFRPHGAFYLNGERLLLRGTHLHEDFAGVGNALSNEQHRADMRQIKGVGANFVRLGHYSHDPSVYQAADELGLLLWDEVPWNRGGVGGDNWRQNTLRHLQEMIRQNRNHPSIIIWSLGNEVYWLPDFEGGGEPALLRSFISEMNDLAHKLDPSRPTAIRKVADAQDIVDVYSPSIWAGWYGGGYHQYGPAITAAQKEHPRLLHVEYGGSSHVGRHTSTPYGGDGLKGGQVSVAEAVSQTGVKSVARGGIWDESYIVDLFDWHLKVSESQPDFVGNAQWAFKDFATPLRPENDLPYMNQKGLVTRDGQPKEAYWVFKSYWTTDPFCRIYGHHWTERYSPGGTRDRIRVYCNVESAELHLNGRPLARKTRDTNVFPASGLYWDVEFKEGENTLVVLGYTGDVQTAGDELTLTYSSQEFGRLDHFEFNARKRNDGLIEITATAMDKHDRRVHDGMDRVYFHHTNEGVGGRLLRAYGTPEKSSVQTLSNGRARILFEPNGDPDPAVIEIRTQNFKGQYLTLDGAAAGL